MPKRKIPEQGNYAYAPQEVPKSFKSILEDTYTKGFPYGDVQYNNKTIAIKAVDYALIQIISLLNDMKWKCDCGNDKIPCSCGAMERNLTLDAVIQKVKGE